MERVLRKLLANIYYYKDGYSGIANHKRNAIRSIRSDVDYIEHFDKLRSIVLHAYKTSPYYRELWDSMGFDPKDFKQVEDLKQLPFLTKEIIQNQKQRMISTLYTNNVGMSYTGGSSGNPTSFYRNSECTSARFGRQIGILDVCGYTQGDRCGLIWGAHADLDTSSPILSVKKKLRKFAFGKETLCCTVMNEEQMNSYYKRLIKFKPNVLYGYPNAMTEFARYISDNILSSIRVKTIICTAESLSKYQRQTLSDVFGGEVYNLYCTREHGCIGFECSEHNGFHIDTGSVFVEIINNDPVGIKNNGEIVVTDLLNYGMPFIRYKIGDMGSLSEKMCSCGCQFPLLKSFDGRVTDLIHKKDGSTVAGLMFLDVMMDVPEIKWFQIIQETLDDIEVFLVVTDGFTKGIEQKLINEMNVFLNGQANIKIKIVPEILRNPISGKFQEVICKIKEETNS
jgi:phenylacetate-CoA ligase